MKVASSTNRRSRVVREPPKAAVRPAPWKASPGPVLLAREDDPHPAQPGGGARCIADVAREDHGTSEVHCSSQLAHPSLCGACARRRRAHDRPLRPLLLGVAWCGRWAGSAARWRASGPLLRTRTGSLPRGIAVLTVLRPKPHDVTVGLERAQHVQRLPVEAQRSAGAVLRGETDAASARRADLTSGRWGTQRVQRWHWDAVRVEHRVPCVPHALRGRLPARCWRLSQKEENNGPSRMVCHARPAAGERQSAPRGPAARQYRAGQCRHDCRAR